MGIGDKKSVLRSMYQKPAAEEAAVEKPAEPSAPLTQEARSKQLEARFDKVFLGLVHSGLYVIFLFGLGVDVAMLYATRARGLALEFEPSTKFVGDGFILIAVSVLLIAISLAVFMFFRAKLPRRFKWFTFACLVAMFPAAIISTVSLLACYNQGYAEGIGRLNADQLLADALEMREAFPLDDNEPKLVRASDFPSANGGRPIPYAEQLLRPDSVSIFPRGVVYKMSDFRDKVIVMTENLSPSDAGERARLNDFRILSTRPTVFYWQNSGTLNTTFLEASGRPSTLPDDEDRLFRR